MPHTWRTLGITLGTSLSSHQRVRFFFIRKSKIASHNLESLKLLGNCILSLKVSEFVACLFPFSSPGFDLSLNGPRGSEM